VQWSTDTSAAAIAARAAEQLSGATADMVTQGNIEVCIISEHTEQHSTGNGAWTYESPLQGPLLAGNLTTINSSHSSSISRQHLHRYHTAGLVQCLSGTISDATADLCWKMTFAAPSGRTSMIPSEHSKTDGTCSISFVLTAYQAASKAALRVSPELVGSTSAVVG
jgi:hypothetical protein